MLSRLFAYLPVALVVAMLVVSLPHLRESWPLVLILAIAAAELLHLFGRGLWRAIKGAS